MSLQHFLIYYAESVFIVRFAKTTTDFQNKCKKVYGWAQQPHFHILLNPNSGELR